MEKGITGLAHLSAQERQSLDQASVFINAKSQGSLSRMPASQIRTMFAKALVPDAKRILLIGLGDGANLHFLARYFPDADITVVEINREITRLIERAAYSDSPRGAGARVRLLQDDGRFLMTRDANTYDLVVTNPVRSADEYSSFLYSVEFFALVSSRLSGNGAFVGMYTPYAPVMGELIGHTVRSVFPEAARAAVGNLIVATKAPGALLSQDGIATQIRTKVCTLAPPQGTTGSRFEACERVVSALTPIEAPGPGARLVRDDRPFNEFYFLLR
jgi:spermidine synthase